PETITGRVTSVNPKGLKLDDGAEWLNFSKFATDLVPPQLGQAVTLTLDQQGFVRGVAVTGASQGAPTGRQASQAQREATITRLAALKAAAEFAASRPQLKSGDVLRIAGSWERWVLR